MFKRLMPLALVLASLSPQAFAGGPGSGFLTGPCGLPEGAPIPGSGETITVPGDHPTIQDAVDAAEPGDHIIVSNGTYKEAVHVPEDKSYIRITGESRDGVVLDGENTRSIGVSVVGADGVVVENMTAHNYTRHAFFWHQLTGYWGRYLTAYNNGLYGIYAFDSRCGQFDHSYGSGNADAAFYVGECFPCDMVIHDVVAEENALGYSGTNAGGGLIIRDSIWRNNAMGIVPNSLDGEERPPQRGAIIRHNLIVNNNHRTTPGVGIAGTFFGVGIAIAGSNGNVVYGNEVIDHELAGIVLSPLPDQNIWLSSGNTIWGNTVTHPVGEAGYERAFDLAQGATSGPGNCWADNEFGSSAPLLLEQVWDCGLTITPPGGDPLVEVGLLEGFFGLNGREPGDWRTWPAPTAPEAFVEMPTALKGSITEWLPALF